jgi:hypothetical protein
LRTLCTDLASSVPVEGAVSSVWGRRRDPAVGRLRRAVAEESLGDVWRLKKPRELVKLHALAPGHRLHNEQAMDLVARPRACGGVE